jgi:hypothetical protein
MQEIINCPGCQRKLQVPETLLGHDVQCPTCGKTFQATLELPPPRPAPPPAYPEDPDDRPPPRSKRRRYDDDYDYEDDYEDGRYRRRRDLEPHRGSLILVFGILSIVMGAIGLVLGPIAWIMGHQDMAEIQAGRMDPDGESSTNAGRICGIVGTVLNVVLIGGCCFFVMLASASRRF